MCQQMPTALYTRWNFDSESQKFMARRNKTRSFENMVLSYFQQTRPECRIEGKVTTGRQKEIDCFSFDGIGNHCNTVLKQGVLISTTDHVKKLAHHLLKTKS